MCTLMHPCEMHLCATIGMEVKKEWWSSLRGSHGLSAKGTKDEVKQARIAQSQPKGSQTRSYVLEGPTLLVWKYFKPFFPDADAKKNW